MLLIDGVRYKLLTPIDEENQFHPMIKEHYKEIFGEDALYFDVRCVLKSASGIGSIPDAYVISLSKPYEWYVVENELSSHPVYNHIVNQLTRFLNGIKNQNSRMQIIDLLYDQINKDDVTKALVKQLINPEEIHHFLSKLLSKNPKIVVIIDQKTSDVEEACQSLPTQDISIVEFKTFGREDAPTVHAHMFQPLYARTKFPLTVTEKSLDTFESQIVKTTDVTKLPDHVEIKLRSQSERKFALLNLDKSTRPFFPGYKIDFLLETDIGEIKTRVTSAKKGAKMGDANAGMRIQGGLIPWYSKHPEVNLGTKVRIDCLEPFKIYKLSVT